jgi:prepilin peptidase dependent protein B
MHLKSFNPQKSTGFTLIELLIGLTLGLMVIASTLTLYVITTRSSSDLLHSTRLNHDLETIMQIMTHDIRRAGYQGGTLSVISDLKIDDSGSYLDACILYSYYDDHDIDPTKHKIKYYGFKRKDNAIALRQSDTYFDCNSNYWEKVTEENVTQITGLTFSDAKSQCFNATATNTGTSKGLCTTVDLAASANDSITKISHITIELKGRTLPKDPDEQLCDDDNPCTPEKTLKASVTVANPYTYEKP